MKYHTVLDPYSHPLRLIPRAAIVIILLYKCLYYTLTRSLSYFFVVLFSPSLSLEAKFGISDNHMHHPTPYGPMFCNFSANADVAPA